MAVLYERDVDTKDGFQWEQEAVGDIVRQIDTRDLVTAIFAVLSEAQKDTLLSRLGGWEPYSDY